MSVTDKQRITVVSACMNASGTPDFALNEVEVTDDEYENGIHYYLAEADLLEAGYEEPFVHFDGRECPAFLIPAVKEYLRIQAVASSPIHTKKQENHRWPASSK